MYKVIVEKRPGWWEALDVDVFEREYGRRPKHTGEKFYIVSSDRDERNLYTNDYPNPACIFIEGQIKYIIYKGGRMIVNGIELPPAEFIDESDVFGSLDEVNEFIQEWNEKKKGERWLVWPDGRKMKI